jgi:ubiquinone biosynthesis protein UbiJ
MKFLEPDWMKPIADQITSGINNALAMSPGSQKQLKNLDGCILKIQLTGLDANFNFGITKLELNTKQPNSQNNEFKYRVQLVDQVDSADVTITGNPLSFIKLFSLKNKASLFQSKELELEGDSVRIQQILALLGSLKIDWDGLLATFIGDVPAHLVGSSIRSGLIWGLNFSQSLIRDTEEFIKYELRLLPDNKRAKNQFSAISALSKEADALTARFNKLELKTNK